MSTQRKSQKRAVTQFSIEETLADFLLEKQSIMCSSQTMRLYRQVLTRFIQWLKTQEVTKPSELQARHIRQFLAELAQANLSDNYINLFARSIKTLVRFLYSEHYIYEPIIFQMPRVGKKPLPYLKADELKRLYQACESNRDKALLLVMVDTGLRRAELCALNWNDVDLNTGVVIVKRGKGNKTRSVVIGLKARRALIQYSRYINHEKEDPLIQTYSGARIAVNGLRSIFLRLGQKTGLHVTPHALRRTFATLALKSGMSIVHIQGLMGHSSIEMTRSYIQSITDDYIEAHHEHSPIDNCL